MGNLIEQQAIDFSNVPIIQRGIKASVHLEDWEDVLFWDTMIQCVSPGRYNYLSYSKTDSGKRASGSSQCKKYIGLTSKRFFVCIDSDMNYLLQTPNIDASHFVAQTYTYSWENHYAEINRLQSALASAVSLAALKFDFKAFLAEYSLVVYHPLLALLHCLRNKDMRITQKEFSACLPHQCKSDELANNGKPILTTIRENFSNLLSNSGILSIIDFKDEEQRYLQMGLSDSNAYLHVRGHNLYDLVKSIGHQLCSKYHIDFENQILNAALPPISDYWEITRVADDLKQILQ